MYGFLGVRSQYSSGGTPYLMEYDVSYIIPKRSQAVAGIYWTADENIGVGFKSIAGLLSALVWC